MKYHILNGDALLERINTTAAVTGQYIVLREALVDGPVQTKSIEEFWNIRSIFFEKTYGTSKENYYAKSVDEINKIRNIPENASVYLWFERDLFCQVNLWFTIHFIKQIHSSKFFYPYLILPNHQEWSGFGQMSGEAMKNCYDQKIQLRKQEMEIFSDLWGAYQRKDQNALRQLSTLAGKSYPYLSDVVTAHIDRSNPSSQQNRPYIAIKKIMNDLNTSTFSEVFREFTIREGIYGFGDLQVKIIYNEVLKDLS